MKYLVKDKIVNKRRVQKYKNICKKYTIANSHSFSPGSGIKRNQAHEIKKQKKEMKRNIKGVN